MPFYIPILTIMIKLMKATNERVEHIWIDTTKNRPHIDGMEAAIVIQRIVIYTSAFMPSNLPPTMSF